VDEPGDPEGKIVKNRTPDDEVERILALGAKLYEDHRTAEGLGWVTLLDPEGNAFCLERSDRERELQKSEVS
jgi:predicted enzyme related to lactoylglutathione lyase